MKRILIISFSDLNSDPRVKRQIINLKDLYDVSAAGFGDLRIGGIRFIKLKPNIYHLTWRLVRGLLVFLGFYELVYWNSIPVKQLVSMYEDIDVELIIANDIDALPVAIILSKKAAVLYDAHEYSPRENEDRLKWRIFFQKYKTYLCRKYIPLCSEMITVCDGISDEYCRMFSKKPSVVMNAANYIKIKPHYTKPERIRLIHHGGAMPSRKIEKMIEMMNYTDSRFELDLMLVPTAGWYMNYLLRQSEKTKRVKVIQPVPIESIVSTISQYDIGIYLLQPNSFNNFMSLPNKFFDFIQARLALAIGPSPEMARIVSEYQLGVVAEDFTPRALAASLNSLDHEKIDYYKNQSHRYARELSSEKNMEKFRHIVDGLMNSDDNAGKGRTCAASPV